MSLTDCFFVDDNGHRTLYVGPSLDDTLPQHVLEGLARRRLLALGQPCPCGAVLVIPNRQERRSARRLGVGIPVQVEHENDCPAICPELLGARWSE